MKMKNIRMKLTVTTDQQRHRFTVLRFLESERHPGYTKDCCGRHVAE